MFDSANTESHIIEAKNTTASRSCLASGFIVSVKIPGNFKLKCIEGDQGESIVFGRFSLPLKGGNVRVFLHSDNPEQYRGKRITASAAVMKSIFNDGNVDIYIDLNPINEPLEISHKLSVRNGPLRQHDLEGDDVFQTACKRGVIVFSPVSKQASVPEPKSEPAAPVETDEQRLLRERVEAVAKEYPNDGQLHSHIGHGWQIDKVYSNRLKLTKMANGHERELMYYLRQGKPSPTPALRRH